MQSPDSYRIRQAEHVETAKRYIGQAAAFRQAGDRRQAARRLHQAGTYRTLAAMAAWNARNAS